MLELIPFIFSAISFLCCILCMASPTVLANGKRCGGFMAHGEDQDSDECLMSSNVMSTMLTVTYITGFIALLTCPLVFLA